VCDLIQGSRRLVHLYLSRSFFFSYVNRKKGTKKGKLDSTVDSYQNVAATSTRYTIKNSPWVRVHACLSYRRRSSWYNCTWQHHVRLLSWSTLALSSFLSNKCFQWFDSSVCGNHRRCSIWRRKKYILRALMISVFPFKYSNFCFVMELSYKWFLMCRPFLTWPKTK